MLAARLVMGRTLCFLRGGFGALFLARYGAILIVGCVLGVRCRDTLEQIDVARLLIDKYHDVRSSFLQSSSSLFSHSLRHTPRHIRPASTRTYP